MPGVSAGTTKAETPLGPATPVRAMTTSTSVSPAPEIKALAPLITYDEPRFSARVDSDAASEPAPGSVRQYEASFSPVTKAGPQACLTASLAQEPIIQVAILCMVKNAEIGRAHV